ncbi:MAG: hypothetical protein PSX80_02710 [bacterium]|nr:hypothetical protein [bacterium]
MEKQLCTTSDWIEFNDSTTELRHRSPHVLLGVTRTFRINAKAYELLGEPKAVRFLFDVGRSRIGIRAESPEKPHAFPVKRNQSGRTVLVRGALFCNKYGIKPDTTVDFQDVRQDSEGTLLLDLTTAKAYRTFRGR